MPQLQESPKLKDNKKYLMKKKNKIFDKLMKNELYKELLAQLPENEKMTVLKAIRDITENFEKNVLEPIKNRSGE